MVRGGPRGSWRAALHAAPCRGSSVAAGPPLAHTTAGAACTAALTTPTTIRSQPHWVWRGIGALGFGLVGVQWMMEDILPLRLVAVGSSLAFICYNLKAVTPPLMMPVYANVVFSSINLMQIVRILISRMEIELTEYERLLFDATFHDRLTKRQLRELLEVGTLQVCEPGELLPCGRSEDGRHALDVLVRGSADVVVGARRIVATLGEGDFVGEMSFLNTSHHAVHSDVVAAERVVFVTWDAELLRQHLERRPAVEHALHAIWSQQLVRRLHSMDERSRSPHARGGRGGRLVGRETMTLMGPEERAELLLDTLALDAAPRHAAPGGGAARAAARGERSWRTLWTRPTSTMHERALAETGHPPTAPADMVSGPAVPPFSLAHERLPWYVRLCVWWHRNVAGHRRPAPRAEAWTPPSPI